MNYLLVEALERYHHFYGEDFKVECPTGSGRMMTLGEVAREIATRLGEHLPARRVRSPALPRRRRALRRRSALEGPGPLPRVLLRRHEPRRRGEPPDGVDGAGRALRRRHVPRAFGRRRATVEEGRRGRRGDPVMTPRPDEAAEWLEADGLGGFASGTVGGIRTRRYHALLLTATTPPTGRMVLVNGFDAWVETERRRFALTSQRYAPDCGRPRWRHRVFEAFVDEPWPHWSFRLDDGTVVEQEIFVPKGTSLVALCWRVAGPASPATLTVRPFLSGRDYHALHHENPDFRFEAELQGDRVTWRPYDVGARRDAPSRTAATSTSRTGTGTSCTRRSAPAASTTSRTSRRPASSGSTWRAARRSSSWRPANAGLRAALRRGRRADSDRASCARPRAERRGGLRARASSARRRLPRQAGDGADDRRRLPLVRRLGARHLHRAARAVPGDGPARRGARHPARVVPCRLGGDAAEPLPGSSRGAPGVQRGRRVALVRRGRVTSTCRRAGKTAPTDCRFCGGSTGCLEAAVLAILDGYCEGHAPRDPHGRRRLARGGGAGRPAHLDGRQGRRLGRDAADRQAGRGPGALGQRAAHRRRLRREVAGGRRSGPRPLSASASGTRPAAACTTSWTSITAPGAVDATFRPNQIFAVGGLPFALVRRREGATRSWTPSRPACGRRLGLRTLAPDDPAYCPVYEGGPRERDGAYHQGTAWPWLLGAFRRGLGGGTRRDGGRRGAEARDRFLQPLLRHLDEAGIGHISEIADAEAPHTPRGCPFQAWSVGEALRLGAGPPAGQRRAREEGSLP